ncbi:MAG: pilus assembly FimT family protein [Gemmatimonadota bacterium]
MSVPALEARAACRGFALVELTIVLLIAGLLLVISWPRIRTSLDRADVKSACTAIVSLHGRARSNAVGTSRLTRLRIAGNRVLVTAVPRLRAGSGIMDTIGPVEDLRDRYGVSVRTWPVSEVTIDGRGIGSPTEMVVRISKGSASDSVLVVQFGRVIR